MDRGEKGIGGRKSGDESKQRKNSGCEECKRVEVGYWELEIEVYI